MPTAISTASGRPDAADARLLNDIHRSSSAEAREESETKAPYAETGERKAGDPLPEL